MITIYLITNINNGKRYVGSTKNYTKRKKTHLQQLRNSSHHNALMQNVFNKYGDIFEFSILEEGICPSVQFDIEYLWAKELSPEYNIGSFGGGDNLTNHPNRLDIIKRIKETIKTNIALMSAQERKAKWGKPGDMNSNWRGGTSKSYCTCGKEKALTAKTCAGCRDRSGELNPFYGRKHSEESISTMRTKMQERVSNGFVPANARLVLTPAGEFVSLSASARAHSITPGAMHYRINSKASKWVEFYYKTPND